MGVPSGPGGSPVGGLLPGPLQVVLASQRALLQQGGGPGPLAGHGGGPGLPGRGPGGGEGGVQLHGAALPQGLWQQQHRGVRDPRTGVRVRLARQRPRRRRRLGVSQWVSECESEWVSECEYECVCESEWVSVSEWVSEEEVRVARTKTSIINQSSKLIQSMTTKIIPKEVTGY